MDISDHYKQQQKYFDAEFSQLQDYSLAPWQESYIQRIKKYLLDKNYKSKTLLDIAPGTGYVAIEMAKLGMHVIACDLSKQAIKNLERYKKKLKLKNLELIVCKAEAIPLKKQSIDYIVANAILEHIPDEVGAINSWRNLLKRNGRMFITVPIKFRYIWPFLWLPNYIHDKRIGHLRRYDLASLQKKFTLKIIKFFYTGHLVKIYPIILKKLFNTNRFDTFFEEKDREKEHQLYGANNISVIFKK